MGQRFQTTTPSGDLRKTIFNKRSLATEHHKCLDEKTSVITAQDYDGQHHSNKLVCSTDALTHKYHEQLMRDGFGRKSQRIVDPSNLALTHTTILDNANRVIAKIDPKEQTSYIVRDAVGNIRFEINAKGGVTEHQYNAANKPVFTVQYQKPIDLTKVTVSMYSDVVAALLTKTNVDRHTHYYYDDLGNERFRVNRQGAVVETRYNLNSQEIANIQYYTAITGDFKSLTTAQLMTQCAAIRDKTKDKAIYRVLDALGQEVFIIGADGSVTQKIYHSTLHKVNAEIKYATKIENPELVASLSIAEITAKLTTSIDDRQTHWIVDGLNRLQFYVNAKGAVTRYDYEGDTNNRSQITEFAAPVIITTYTNLLTQLSTLKPNPAVDNIETQTYDGAERLITRTNALGASETFKYDGASRQSQHTTFSGYAWNYDYDGASRLWHEISPSTTVYQASIDPKNVTAINVAPTQGTVVKETVYDKNSNALSIISGVGLDDEHTVNFAYDALNQKNQDSWHDMPIDDPSQNTSLLVRPEKSQTVSKVTVHGAHGAKLVTLDEASNPTFYVYNSEGQLHYRINAEGYVIEYQRNSFGEAEHFIVYANQLPINLNNYVETGLTANIVESNLTKNPSKDRSFNRIFDQQGKITQQTRDAVVCYIPNSNPSVVPTVANQIPTKQFVHNAFGETIAVTTVIDATNNVSTQTLTWYDGLGNEMATVDSNGKPILQLHDSRGRKIEEYRYANCIPPASMPTAHTSFSDLRKIVASIADPTRDHQTKTSRDILGQEIGVYHVGVITQQMLTGQQDFVDKPVATLGVTYTYTYDNKIKTITFPDGQMKIRYYDERRYLIAEADVVREQTTPTGGVFIRPITYYRPSIHGDRVETFKPLSGCAIDLDPTSDVLPLPLSKSAQDQCHRFLRDPRRNILVMQDPENNLKQITHTVTGKIARKYKPTTNETKTAAECVTHVDESKKSYDQLDRLTSVGVYRDGELKHQLDYKHDAFNLIGVGPGDGTYPDQYQFDQAGRKWSVPNDKGGVQLMGNDAAGNQTVEIGSLKKDLTAVAYTDLQTIMEKSNDVANFEFLETLRDATSRTKGFVEPGYIDPTSGTLVRPTFQFTLNNFDKKTSTTNATGDVTAFEYNKLNNLTKQIDPAIQVVDEHGSASTVSAVTEIGYNDSGQKIGVRDANNHTELWARDAAGQVIWHSTADGVHDITNSLDSFGRAVAVITATGGIWRHVFDRRNKIKMEISPSGDAWNFRRNENGFVIEETPPAASALGITRFAQGIYGDMSARYAPGGEAYLYEHDRHHQELMYQPINSDGSVAFTVSYQRDFWGKPIYKQDGSGSTYQYLYYLSGDLKQKKGISVYNHGSMIIFDSPSQNFTPTLVDMPQQNLNYAYLTSRRLHTITDNNAVKPQTLLKLFDLNRRVIFLRETNSSNRALRQMTMAYNARGWPTIQTDIDFLMTNDYDPVGNRRRSYAEAYGLQHEAWYTTDVANRELVNDGVLQNGVIQSTSSNENNWGYLPPSSYGNTFAYAQGLRNYQAWLTRRSMARYCDAFSGDLGYDINDRVSSVSVVGAAPAASSASSAVTIQPISDIFLLPSRFPSQTIVKWTAVPNETLANTAVFAVGGGQVILASDVEFVSQNNLQATFNNLSTRVSYNIVVIVNVNSVVYQASIPVPAPCAGFD